jgi:hypothetical protein
MAGSPLKRARKQGVRLTDGSIIAFPHMPRVADLPSGWRHFTTAEKIEHLIGLDRWEEILSWGPITELDPLRLSFHMQVMRIFLRIGLNSVLDGTLACEAARERATGSASSQILRGAKASGLSHPRQVRGKPGVRGGVARKCGTASETARDFQDNRSKNS